MNRPVYITAGKIRTFNGSEKELVTRQTRKFMRFARRSGMLFLAVLYELLEEDGDLPGMQDESRGGKMPSERRSVFYGEDLNISPDSAHREELLHLQEDGPFDEHLCFDFIRKNWSAIEVLKEVPNIPCFLAAQMTGSHGHSQTLIEGDAAGMLALREAWDTLQNGQADIAYVGGASCKQDKDAEMLYHHLGFYGQGDLDIRDAGAALILETAESMKRTGRIPLAGIRAVTAGFSPAMCLDRPEKEEEMTEFLVRIATDAEPVDGYTAGMFSRKYEDLEKKAAREAFPYATFYGGPFARGEYRFSADGLCEVVSVLNRPGVSAVASFDRSGHQVCAVIENTTTSSRYAERCRACG